MKKTITLFLVLSWVLNPLFAQKKLITRAGHAAIFSETVAETIAANNYAVTGTIDPESGEIVISVPVQNFEFEKALMQEHFNSSNFMDSKQFPRILMKGKIDHPSGVNFSKDGRYEVTVSGELTIKGTTKPLKEKATILIAGGKPEVSSDFTVQDIGSYGVGKPKGSKKNNVADNIKVSYHAVYAEE